MDCYFRITRNAGSGSSSHGHIKFQRPWLPAWRFLVHHRDALPLPPSCHCPYVPFRSAMDLGILLAFAVMVASMILVCAYRLCRVILAEEQAERARERERALRERAARSRLAEALDPKLLGAFSDLVTYADVKLAQLARDADVLLARHANVKLERDADVLLARHANVKLERDADVQPARDAATGGSAPSSPCTAKGSVTLADVTVAEVKLPGIDDSRVGDGSSLQEDGTTVVVDIRGEGTGADGSECSSRKAECLTGCESTSSEPHYAASKHSSPLGGEGQGLLPDAMPAGQPECAAVAGSGDTVGASEVAVPVIAVTAAECAVCLVEFEDDDMLRRMHCCRHLFHQVSLGEGSAESWGMGVLSHGGGEC
ncbi:unnamed protein product [Closterium sp. Yama58-4]|nr:unnamed protein product [Closterium sp. Yama58-4]